MEKKYIIIFYILLGYILWYNSTVIRNMDDKYFKDVPIVAISANALVGDRQKSLDLITKYSKFWMQVIGTRLNVGKKTVNASTKFGELFEEV
mgnify:CR=1 FL=1